MNKKAHEKNIKSSVEKKIKADDKNFLKDITKILENLKAEDIKVIDVEKKIYITAYFIVATANSETHLDAISKEIRKYYKQEYKTNVKEEGFSRNGWILLDLDRYVVHLFLKDKRELYKLETIWY